MPDLKYTITLVIKPSQESVVVTTVQHIGSLSVSAPTIEIGGVNDDNVDAAVSMAFRHFQDHVNRDMRR